MAVKVSRLPTGTILDYAGSSAPAGFLLCYGQAISRKLYPGLFAILGTTYGVGDGSTTFNLPDCRGRVVAGKDDMGGSSANRLTSPLNGDTLGGTGGAESVTITTTTMPSHTHTVYGYDVGGGSTLIYAPPGTMNSGGPSSHTSLSTGSDGAHANVQPTIIFNKIIKV